MRDVLIDFVIGAGLTVVVLMPWWVPLYHDWIDGRRVRRVMARRAQFHAVKFPDEERRREAQRWN